ncbi:hypothetical protein DACRYDRAFT_21169 [Dacryopinax primogenitus]|uniref:Symplekin n=1 Tax=Dacryopinax primogenitus (strain DJM 731) TaxID=1858805 RepID=M5G4P1_DACPD|nr:uncharacterized protein DACRYDRAFT_21169 [Dacryopinax primogenitus]EJU03654.1 hypothetical protein DACRYDRAFT_21169 [Dacryopinax primogenitus]
MAHQDDALSAGTPDPLQLLSSALSAPADSAEQGERLVQLRVVLENNRPSLIPIMISNLLPTTAMSVDSVLKRWLLDLVLYALGSQALDYNTRTGVAMEVVSHLAGLLYGTHIPIVKTVISCFSSIYPLIFRAVCQPAGMAAQKQWEIVLAAKDRIFKLLDSPTAPLGIKLCALKFMQRAILVQGRGPTDPRLQNIADPNLSLVPTGHPFISPSQLENEGVELLQKMITLLFKSNVVEIISALVNCFDAFVRLRPALGEVILQTLEVWTPTALAAQSPTSIRSVERSIRILLTHWLRSPHGPPHTARVHQILQKQAERIQQAAAEEDRRQATLKRPAPSEDENPHAAQRLRLDPAAAAGMATLGDLSAFDVSTLPPEMVVDLVIANLALVSEQELMAAVQTVRQAFAAATSSVTSQAQPAGGLTTQEAMASALVSRMEDNDDEDVVMEEEEEEDDEDMEYEPDKLNEQLSLDLPATSAHGVVLEADDEDVLQSLRLANYELPLPKPVDPDSRTKMIQSVLSRLWENGKETELQAPEESDAEDIKAVAGLPAHELWMLTLVRMVTRGSTSSGDDSVSSKSEDDSPPPVRTHPSSDDIRQRLYDFVLSDFPNRIKVATTWLTEEWINDKRHTQDELLPSGHYEKWLRMIVEELTREVDSKDKSLNRFLMDVPVLPPFVFGMMRELCVVEQRMAIGFGVLREIAMSREPLRKQALEIVFDLTTHPVKVTRNAAIITTKRWVQDNRKLESYTRAFASQMLKRLSLGTAVSNDANINGEPPDMDEESKHLNASETETAEPKASPAREKNLEYATSYVPEVPVPPVDRALVQQYLELYFVLCLTSQEMLDEIFDRYPYMDSSVQEAIQDLITNLVKTLGQSNGKLLTLLRTFPAGSETLALRVLNILTETRRPSAPLVALIKAIVAERNLDVRFLMPILSEMEKADILRYLPRIVATLTGQAAEKALVRSVFSSIVTAPPQTFATSSNQPRAKQSELLTPVELMVLLHHIDRDAGLKPTIEAIQLCFSMTDIYRSDVLAAVIQQLVDEPTLPTLFMRTVIMTVQRYKTLTPFVSTTILARLIPKKVWEQPPLWDGFLRCAKMIAPSSYAVLLQLPKAQLRDAVSRDADLRSGLKDFMVKRGGNNRARLVEIFGEDDESGHPNITGHTGSSPAPPTPTLLPNEIGAT